VVARNVDDGSSAGAVPKGLAASAFASVSPGEHPTPGALWSAVGKTRGLVESLTPGVGFLTVYTLTGDVLLSVGFPVILAVIFIALRVIMRSPVVPALAGFVGIAGSAAVALFSGRAEDNFLLGFGVNAVWIVALVVSLLIGRPLVGWIAALLTVDTTWREDPATKRIAVVATVLWIALFVGRLAVQLPLYFAGSVGALGVAKLVMGIPLYAAALWITWLLFRAVYQGKSQQSQ